MIVFERQKFGVVCDCAEKNFKASVIGFLNRPQCPSKPALVTAVGQSADFVMIKVLLTRNKVPFSADAELERAKALMKRAKELGMKIITVHVGGAARRGSLSDEFIETCMAASDYAIVVADGDQDGFFTKRAKEANIVLTKVERISAPGAPLAAAFK